MGYIREPKGVDFIVAPSLSTADDRALISNAIAAYRKAAKASRKTGVKTVSKVQVVVARAGAHYAPKGHGTYVKAAGGAGRANSNSRPATVKRKKADQ